MSYRTMLGLAFVGLSALLLTNGTSYSQGKKKKPADNPPEAVVEEIKSDPKADAVARIGWALEMAEEGRKERSPSTLLSAAVLLRKIPAVEEATDRPVTTDDMDKTVAAAEAGKIKSLREQGDELLTEAQVLAAQLKQEGKMSTEQLASFALISKYIADEPLVRGAFLGPKRFQNPILPRMTDRYDVKFVSGMPASVVVRTTGSAPVRVSVHNGDRRIAEFTGKTVNLNWMPGSKSKSGHISFTIRVHNAGKQGTAYQMFTN